MGCHMISQNEVTIGSETVQKTIPVIAAQPPIASSTSPETTPVMPAGRPDRMLTREEVSRRVGISTRTLRRAERELRIVFHKDSRGRGVVSEEELFWAPILRPSEALRPCGITSNRYRSYLYRAQRRMKAKPLAGDRRHRFMSITGAERIARLIKDSEDKTRILCAWSLSDARERRDKARKQLANGIDPGEARKAQKAAQVASCENSFEVVAREWHGSRHSVAVRPESHDSLR